MSKGRFSIIPEVEESEGSTAELQKKIKKLKTELAYKKAGFGLISTAIKAPKVIDQVYGAINNRNKSQTLDRGFDKITVNSGNNIRKVFTEKAGYYDEGFMNTMFYNKIKNSSRVPSQRVQIRPDVIEDDFYNYWAETMINNENKDLSIAFKNVMGKNYLERLKSGEYSVNEVAKFYGSEEYNNYANTKTINLKPGYGVSENAVENWGIDLAESGGIKAYIEDRAAKWNLTSEELHYMMLRDGGYKSIPTAKLANITADDMRELGIDKDLYIKSKNTMNPANFDEWNEGSKELFGSDGLSHVTINDEGIMSISDDYLNSGEYLNLPEDFKQDLQFVKDNNLNISDITDPIQNQIVEETAEEAATSLADVGGKVASAGFDVATLANDDADEIDKALSAANLANTAAVALNVSTGPVGMIISGLSLLNNMSKGGQQTDSNAKLLASIDQFEEEIEDFDKAGRFSLTKGLV